MQLHLHMSASQRNNYAMPTFEPLSLETSQSHDSITHPVFKQLLREHIKTNMMANLRNTKQFKLLQ